MDFLFSLKLMVGIRLFLTPSYSIGSPYILPAQTLILPPSDAHMMFAKVESLLIKHKNKVVTSRNSKEYM